MSKHIYISKESLKSNRIFDDAIKKPSISKTTATYNRWGMSSYSSAKSSSDKSAHPAMELSTTATTTDTLNEDVFSFDSDGDGADALPPAFGVNSGAAAKRHNAGAAKIGNPAKRNGEKRTTNAALRKSRKISDWPSASPRDGDLFSEYKPPDSSCSYSTSPCNSTSSAHLDDASTQKLPSPSHSSFSHSSESSEDNYVATSELNFELDFDNLSQPSQPPPASTNQTSSSSSYSAVGGDKPPIRCTIRINNAAKKVSERLKVMDSTSAASLSKYVDLQQPIVRRILSGPIKVTLLTSQRPRNINLPHVNL